MGFNVQVKRSKFFNELSEERQQEFFDMKISKVLPCIDNIYYSIFIDGDTNGNTKLTDLIKDLTSKKKLVQANHTDLPIFTNLLLTAGGFNIYKFRLTNPELYDIFILDYLPNDDTPRILIQLRAYGLWLQGSEKMINESFLVIRDFFQKYYPDVKFSKVRENRIDYCYHTNLISNPYKTFADTNLENTLKTEFSSFGFRGHLDKSHNEIKMIKDYFSLGERSSNNIFVRIYNKALEVVELAYKNFFFVVWYQNGLINFYDKFCFEYAYEKKDLAYIHKAKCEFYLMYGNDAKIKEEFQKALADELAPMKYKEICNGIMPDCTTVINVEFETKRKFYYYSDRFIDEVLKTNGRELVDPALERIYKIIDNRGIFLDYLTSKTLSFKNGDDYVDWWSRIRRVKLPDTVVSSPEFIREYSKELNKNIVIKRAANAISTVALYNGNDGYNFTEDVSDLLSNFNDNDSFYFSYAKNKAKKHKRLKNLL